MKSNEMRTANPIQPDQQAREVRRVVEDVLEVSRWHGTHGDCTCPHGHDARVYIDGVPFLHCFHTSCEADVAGVNAELRDRFMGLPEGIRGHRPKPTPEEQAEERFSKRLRLLAAAAKNRLLPTLRAQPVPVETWPASSPFPVGTVPVEQHWKLLLAGLYPLDTHRFVWMGEKHESGPDYTLNFKKPQDWLAKRMPYGPQVSTVLFSEWGRNEKGIKTPERKLSVMGSRSKVFMDRALFTVLESDVIPKDQFGAVITYARKYTILRAIVDTGGKSIHAWFDPFADPVPQFPPRPQKEIWEKVPLDNGGHRVDIKENPNYEAEAAAWVARYGADWEEDRRRSATFSKRKREFYVLLEGLGCDKNMLTDCLTARLPGVERCDDEGRPTGRMQRLLYLNPINPIQESLLK